MKQTGMVTIGMPTEEFRLIVARLAMYQNSSFIDDLEFNIEKDTLDFCQSDELLHIMVVSKIPISFFDKFEIKGTIDKIILPVRTVLTSVDSMFSDYKDIMIRVKLFEDNSAKISLMSSREALELKAPESPRITKEVAVNALKKFEKLKVISTFDCAPSEFIDIGYNDNTTTLLSIQKDKDLIYLTSESDLSGTKYAKKIPIEGHQQTDLEVKYMYNLEYLKYVLVNQKENIEFTIFSGGLLKIKQSIPYEIEFYVSPLEGG